MRYALAPAMSSYTLSHLEQLESESIHVIREVVAEFHKPVMLFSIGKDSCAMLRLAQKAFAPAKLPFHSCTSTRRSSSRR